MRRTIHWLFIFAGLVIADASHAIAAEVTYKSSALRDPFADALEEKPVDDSSKVEASLRAMTLQGVIVSGESKSAIINGKIHKIGSKVGLGEVKDIDRDGVIILYNGKEIKLQLIKRNPSNEKKAGPTLTAPQK